MLFHTHFYQETKANPQVIFCKCGSVKNLHQHKWEKTDINITDRNNVKHGLVLKCTGCGELKRFSANDY